MDTILFPAMKTLTRTLCLFLLAASPVMAQEARIDWDAARRDAAAVTSRAALPVNRPAAILEEIPLPVLLPALAELVLSREGGAPGVLLFTRPGSYTASFRIDRVGLELTGMARAALGHDAGGGVPAATLTEAGQDASFSRYGAGYTLSIRCSDPQADPRCTDADFARYIVDNLVVAGGSGL